MATTNYKKLEKELYNLQKEHQLLKEEQIKSKNEQIKFKKEQNSKFRRFVVFAVALCLIISGVSGVASYSLAATQVGYTPKDTSWTVQNTGDAIDELRDSVGASLVGSVFSYMGTTAPYGYLACDGTEYNIDDYPRLANHINAHFGSPNFFGGDGETTFAVPDLRGEFLRGTGTNSHTSQGSGATVGTHQDSTEIPRSYAGNGSNRQMGIANTDGRWDFWLNKQNLDSITSQNNNMVFTTGSYYSNSGATGTIRPTNTSVLYIIKY